jgi:hypothetical protein
VTLEPGGRATVELRVERNGNDGPIQVQVAGAPQGITATPAQIPAGQSVGQLALAADAAAADKLSGKVDVTIKAGQATATQSVAVTVSKPNVPAFQPLQGIIVQPGTTATINLTVQRNGFAGPIEMRAEGVSDKVAIRAGNLAAGQNESKLEIVAAADAPAATYSLRIAGIAQGQTFNVTVPLQIDAIPFSVNSFKVVTLKPGESKTIEVPVVRRSYKGAVKIDIENLPEGVTVPPIEVPVGQAAASVKLTAAENTKELIRTARVIGSADHLTARDVLLIRISRGESGFLPREVTSNKELAGLLRGGSFGGRLTAQSKQALVEAYGGTRESEEAVMLGLKWLYDHQQKDGRWSLKSYNQGIQGCSCHTAFESDVQDNDTAGTAFGLLPFLGAGITHNRAPTPELEKYRRTVKEGLDFLIKNQVKSKDANRNGSLGGTMYSHSLGAMALCEAYGLSRDEKLLKIPAQLAIRYLIEAQHGGGGWRYGPNQPGDMSATGWVFLAIQDGRLAGLPFQDEPLKKAERFLDSVAKGPDDAKLSRYAYEPERDPTLTLTAAGLLTRQYIGWKKDNPDLIAGCKFMMQPPHLAPASGPAGGPLGPIYYYYYATQVLHHMEGEEFDLWNYRMREHLIRTQQRYGHKAGSWEAEGADWGKQGGRLYSTSLALLTLQVYYRHLPMYRSLSQIKELAKTKE